MSVTNAPQNAPDNGVAAALLSVARSPEPATALRPLVMMLMPSRNRPTPPRSAIVVDMRAAGGGRRAGGGALGLVRECGAHFGQLLFLCGVDLGVFEIEVFHRFHDRSSDNEPSKPSVVGWYDEPRRVLRCGGANRFFVRMHVVVPKPTFVHVSSGELPVLLGFIEALHEALLLFLSRHVEKELEDDNPLTTKVVLEVRDVGDALVPDALP